MATRQGNSAGVLRADGDARVQIGDTHSYTFINNNHNPGSRLTGSHLAETDKEKVRANFLRRLNTVPYVDRKDRNPKRVKGTCEWFTTHDLFRNWRQEASAMLWVSADPGCGKSVLAKYLVDEVLAPSATRITCYFFFKDDFDDQRTIESALCCVLHQLFVQKPDLLLDKYLDEFKNNGERNVSSFEGLWRILTETAGRHEEGEIVCILDALDECVEHKRLAAGLTQLFSQGKGASRLKFLVTSRPYRDIGRGFQDLEDSQPTIHLSGDNPDEVDKIAQEINLVIDHRIEQLRKTLHLSMDETQILHQELTAISHRTYLWVHLIFPILEQDVFFSRAEMRARIHKLPRTVNEAYDRILRKSCDPDKARKVLRIIVAADRPLSLTEMAAALALRGETHQCHQDLERDLSSLDGLRNAIRDTCGLFVVIQASGIYLLHQTAREFLVRLQPTQSEMCTSLEWEHSLDLEDSHYLLSEICIRYLLLADFEMLKGVEKYRTTYGKHRFDFLEYAASNWAHHYQQAHNKSGVDLQCLALKLCETSSPTCTNWLDIYGYKRLDDPGFSNELPTSLLIASYFGLDQLVDCILRGARANLNARGAHRGRNALSWASERGYISIVKSLLKKVHGYQVFFKDMSATPTSVINRKDTYGRTPLWYAVANGHLGIARLLLCKGAKFAIQDANGARQNSGSSYLDVRDDYGETPLTQASKDGNTAVLKLLLEGGANVNASNRIGKTALCYASEQGQDVVVKQLIDRGADIDAVTSDPDRLTPLGFASYGGQEATTKLLLDLGANVNGSATSFSPLCMAVNRGHYTIAKLLLDRKAKVDPLDWHEYTPLMRASCEGHELMVKLLLDHGANIDASTSDGITVVMCAAASGHIGILELLLKQRANIHKQTSKGRSALVEAASYGHSAFIELLLDRGVEINEKDAEGRKALHEASGEGYVDTVKLLLDRGAGINEKDAKGSTALHEASWEGDVEIVKLLLDRGAGINEKDDGGSTALQRASWGGDVEIVKLLLDLGAGINEKDNGGSTALHKASARGFFGTVALLLDRGASINDQDDRGQSARKLALKGRHNDVADMLLERGALKGRRPFSTLLHFW